MTRAAPGGGAGRLPRRPGVAVREEAGRRRRELSGSSTVPLEQMGQSAVKRLWRQNRDTDDAG